MAFNISQEDTKFVLPPPEGIYWTLILESCKRTKGSVTPELSSSLLV